MLQVMRTIDPTQEPLALASASDAARADRSMADRIMDEFHGAMRELRCVGTERLVRAGVSMTHLHVMGLLSRHGETSMSRMAELLDVSLSNATGIIDRMAERGLVERVRVPDDRRIVLVRLSEAGQVELDTLEILRRDVVQKILDRLDTAQLERLAQALTDIHEAVAGLVATEGAEVFGTAHTHAHGYPQATGLGHTVAH